MKETGGNFCIELVTLGVEIMGLTKEQIFSIEDIYYILASFYYFPSDSSVVTVGLVHFFLTEITLFGLNNTYSHNCQWHWNLIAKCTDVDLLPLLIIIVDQGTCRQQKGRKMSCQC